MITNSDRKSKIELVKSIVKCDMHIFDFQPWIFIVQKDDKNFIADGRIIRRVISESELSLINCPKIFIDEQDLSV
jgi:hypothetical protein